MDNDLDLKFLALGNSGVGKTCLLNRFVDGEFNSKLAPTVGIDIRDKNIAYTSPRIHKAFNVHLQFWDTAGHERFRALTKAFFRDVYGFFLVFDLTNEKSLIAVRDWISAIHENAYSDTINMILVGNKCDLESQRVISRSKAEDFAKDYDIRYIETSALNNTRVEEAVRILLDLVMIRLEKDQNFTQAMARKTSTIQLREPIDPESANNIKKKQPGVSYCCLY